MKASIGCLSCMLARSQGKACLASPHEGKRYEFMRRALRYLARWFGRSSVPSWYTIEENKILVRVTGNADPFRAKKRHAIGKARECLPPFAAYVARGRSRAERFRRAILLSVCGNRIEISAPQHKVDVDDLSREIRGSMRRGLSIDDSRRIYERALKAKSILFLCDNCGETVLDAPLLSMLSEISHLTIAVSTKPIEDDVCLLETKAIGLRRYGKVVGKGGAVQGVHKGENSKEFWRILEGADLVIAKGMACYETLTEYPKTCKGKSALLFTVKCGTVSNAAGQDVGSNVAMFYS